MRLLFAIFLIFLFIGCRDNITEPVILKNQAITKTQKKEVQIEGKRFLAVGTYLNDIDHPALRDDENEHFIVSLYEGGDNPFQEPISTVTLNGEPAFWEKLESDSPLLKMIPFFNAWGIYYHIWAPKVYPDELNLKIEIDPIRQVGLTFQKDPK